MTRPRSFRHRLYRHYKGGLYRTLHTGRHSETQEEVVIYASLDDFKVWVRPMAMFHELVDLDGQDVPRFEYCYS